MATIQKTVRFYEPRLVDQQDQSTSIESGFWRSIRDASDGASPQQRTVSYQGVQYWGKARTAQSPAISYIHIGRKRPRADWPDFLEAESDDPEALALSATGALLERSYLVPFGTRNYVACMPPFGGRLSVKAMERWLTTLAGHDGSGNRIELFPIVDEAVADKLADAVGVTRLQVKFSTDTELPPPEEGSISEVERAVRAAETSAQGSRTAEVILSYGHSRGDEEGRAGLLATAKMLARARNLEKAELTLLLEQDDTFKTEWHNLLKDTITARVEVSTDQDLPATEESVLTGINEAIQQFRDRG